jgi:hypothetical protein
MTMRVAQCPSRLGLILPLLVIVTLPAWASLGEM